MCCVREIELKTRGRFRRDSLPQQKASVSVQHFTYNMWTQSKEAPPLYSMLEFVNQVRRWYYNKNCHEPIAVQVRMSYCIEQYELCLKHTIGVCIVSGHARCPARSSLLHFVDTSRAM